MHDPWQAWTAGKQSDWFLESDSTRRKCKPSLPQSKQGRRWWDQSLSLSERGIDVEGFSFIGTVPDLTITEEERGRILGDRGSTIRKVVQAMCIALGYDMEIHGRPPFVNINRTTAGHELEIELYPPFNCPESFAVVEAVVREAVREIKEQPIEPATRHCMRPARIQYNDWVCPNKTCGNLCFAKRFFCPLCKTPKPKLSSSLPPSTDSNEPDWKARNGKSRPPKHRMTLVAVAEPGHWRPNLILGSPSPGESQLVWLLERDRYSEILRSQHAGVQDVRSCANVKLVVTDEPYIYYVGDVQYCMVFMRGTPENIRKAKEMLQARFGGRLAADGFEALLAAVENALEEEVSGCLNLDDLSKVIHIQKELAKIEDLMYAIAACNLAQVLQQWPEHFGIEESSNKELIIRSIDGAAEDVARDHVVVRGAIQSAFESSNAHRESSIAVHPLDIRFSHSHISSKFRNGVSLDETIHKLIDGRVEASDFPPLELVEHDGRYVSLSNRRLFVFRVVANLGILQKVTGVLYHMNSPRVQRLVWDPLKLGYLSKFERAYSTTNAGTAVHVWSRFRDLQWDQPLYSTQVRRDSNVGISTHISHIETQRLHAPALSLSTSDNDWSNYRATVCDLRTCSRCFRFKSKCLCVSDCGVFAD